MQDYNPGAFAKLQAELDYLPGENKPIDENYIRPHLFHELVFPKRKTTCFVLQGLKQIPDPVLVKLTGIIDMLYGGDCMRLSQFFKYARIEVDPFKPGQGTTEFRGIRIAGEYKTQIEVTFIVQTLI